MYARTIQASIVPGKTDEALALYRDEILPVLRTMPGYLSTTVMVDRDDHRALVCTVWDSQEAAEATGEGSEYLNRMLSHVRFVLVSREIHHWDVPISDRAADRVA